MTHDPRPLFARVLHPTDLSEHGQDAFVHGLRIALSAKGALTIVHTTGTAAAGDEWRAFPKVRERLVEWGHLPAGASEVDVRRLGLTVIKADLRIHDAARGIAAYGDRHGCDLIVLATHARRGLHRWLTHNVAEPLARASKIPTLFLPDSSPGFIDAATGRPGLRNILVPVDLSPDPGRAIKLAAGLAQLLEADNATLTLLHVGAEFDAAPLRPVEGMRLHWMRRDGPPVDAILAAANETNADLVVMATRGHDGFLDALRGSTTEQVLRQADRPVLAVPEY